MPGYLLTSASQVSCAHSAPALPSMIGAKVTIMGQPVVIQAPHSVTGCPNAPGSVAQPCVTVQWATASTRVTVMGQPVLLDDSQGTAIETGLPVRAVAGQAKVKAI